MVFYLFTPFSSSDIINNLDSLDIDYYYTYTHYISNSIISYYIILSILVYRPFLISINLLINLNEFSLSIFIPMTPYSISFLYMYILKLPFKLKYNTSSSSNMSKFLYYTSKLMTLSLLTIHGLN